MGDVADMGVVYLLTVPGHGRYIGSTHDLKRRMRQHLYLLRNGAHYNRALQDAFNFSGKLEVGVLADVTGVQLEAVETQFIRDTTPEFNHSKTEATRKGSTQSAEAKAKISAANAGRKHTEGAIAAIRESLRGNTRAIGNTSRRVVTPELHKEILILRMKGLGCRRIASQVGVSKHTVLNVFNGKYDYVGS